MQFRGGTTRDRIEEILAATGTRIEKNLGTPFIYVLRISGGSSADETIRQLTNFTEVQHAEPNRVMRIEPGVFFPSINREPSKAEKNLP